MPTGEDLIEANIFANSFSAMGSQYPHKDFRAEGWIYGPPQHWWRVLVSFIMKKCRGSLQHFGLYIAVKTTKTGFGQCYHKFFGLLEMYNPDFGTFFTTIGELGITYQEMHYVSKLPYS